VRRALLAIAILVTGGLACSEPDPEEPHDGPSVLVLVMDTVRADRCSFQGYAPTTTPRLARFAEEAVLYQNAYVPGGWTGPVHASLFTGLRPENHGFLLGNRLYLTDGQRTLAELLSMSGWSTAAFSGNLIVAPDYGMSQGFHRFEMFLEPPQPRSAEIHAGALEFMKSVRGRGRPFFVFINDFEAHTPYDPPESFAQKFVADDAPAELVRHERLLDTPRSVLYLFDPSAIPPAAMKVRSDLYDAEIASLDDEVGKLLDDMKAAGLLENTIVVIASDHGEHFGERGNVEHFGSLYRPILHVPLMVRVPGRLEGGRVDDIVRIEDLFPTILAACGMPIPGVLDGESLLDLDPSRPRVARAWHGPRPFGTLRLELAEFPLHEFDRVTRSAIYAELFDVDADPLETTNVIADHLDVRDRLRALLPLVR